MASASQLSRDTVLQEAGDLTAASNAEQSSGVVEGVKAGLEGAADTATFGLYGAVRGAIDPEGARDMRVRAQERSGARFVGELGAYAASGATGLLGKATAPGLARAAGGVFGEGAVAQGVEGAILGAGGYIAETNVTGDPLTIESLVISAGVGGVIDLGFHMAANKIEGQVWKGKKAQAEAAVEAADIEDVKKGVKAFQDTPPSWNEFVELHEAKQSAIKDYNKEVAREAKAYSEHLTPEGLNKTMAKFDEARTEVLAEVQAVPEVRSAMEAHSAATKAFDKTQKAWDRHVSDNKLFTDKLNAIQTAIDAKRNEFSPLGAPRDIHKVKTVGVRGTIDAASGQFKKLAKGSKYQTGRVKQVISEQMDNDLKGYSKELSEVIKRKTGGYKQKGGDWVKDPSVAPDPEGALEMAQALSKKVGGHLGGKGIPSFPMRPTAPVEPAVMLDPAVAQKVGAARELGKAVNDARTLMRQGRFEDASLVLSDAKARLGQFAGDRLPTMPLAPRQVMAELPGELPKTLDEFTRKHTAQIAEMAANVSDPQSQAALYRVMKDLDLEIKGNPADDMASMHKTLGDYRRKITEFSEKQAKLAAEESKKPAILKLLKMAAESAGRRAFDVGGVVGGLTRTVGGKAVGRGMTAVEGVAFGAVAQQERGGIRGAIRNLVTKHGEKAATGLRKMGPPLAYLKSGFLNGEPDKSSHDPAQLAINRIHEVQSAALAAPDAAFLAVQGMLGQDGDIAWKMHQHVVGTLNYLASTLPKDSGLDTKLFGSNWSPQYHEAIALAHRLEAVQDPLTAIARAVAGDSHPAATEALWAIYPSVMNELAHELSVASPNLKKLTYEQASAYSNLFRTPLTGLQQPAVFSAIQGMYMAAPQSAAPPPGGPQGGGGKQAPGRPAAVQSRVAGSSPGALTGQ